MKSINLILVLILVAFFMRGVFLVGVFPIFKGQDESRHYNTVQYLSTNKDKDCQINQLYSDQNKGDLATYRYSDEIREAARVVQNEKARGEYYDKVNFTNSIDGIGEEEFKENKYSKTQHICPPDVASSGMGIDGSSIYQWGVRNVENLLGSYDIFVRYSALRIVSVLLGVAMLVMAYHIFRGVYFTQKQSLVLTAIISFQPSLSIYFTNINYDVLLIPLWTGVVLTGVIIFRKGWNVIRGIILFILFGLAVLTKASALPLIGLIMFLIGRAFYKKIQKGKINWYVASGIIFVGAVISYLLLQKAGVMTLFSEKYISTIGEYLSKSLPKIYGSSKDYWGVLGWIADNLTLSYVKAIWTIEWIAWTGLALWVVGLIGKRKGKTKEKKYLWLMIVSIVVLQIGIRIADWKLFTITGRLELGTPGRYWFPNIVPHFALLAMGLKILVEHFKSKGKEKFLDFLLLFLLILMMLFWYYEVVNVIIPRFYL